MRDAKCVDARWWCVLCIKRMFRYWVEDVGYPQKGGVNTGQRCYVCKSKVNHMGTLGFASWVGAEKGDFGSSISVAVSQTRVFQTSVFHLLLIQHGLKKEKNPKHSFYFECIKMVQKHVKTSKRPFSLEWVFNVYSRGRDWWRAVVIDDLTHLPAASLELSHRDLWFPSPRLCSDDCSVGLVSLVL